MKTILAAILCLSLFNIHGVEKGSLESYQAKFTKVEQGYQEKWVAEKSNLAAQAYQDLNRAKIINSVKCWDQR